MRRILRMVAATLLGCSTMVMVGAPPASADVALIDFSADELGGVPNGFVSLDDPRVSFTDSVGADLRIGDFNFQSDGPALLVGNDVDDSALIMDFTAPASSVSLDFGNDDPNNVDEGSLAVLTLFDDEGVGTSVSVVLNRDDVMNQTISLDHEGAVSASFQYQNPDGTAARLAEIVDNIAVVFDTEVCDNGVDDNGDGVVDGDDPDCSATIAATGTSVDEGDSGTTDLGFDIALSTALEDDVTIDYEVVGGTATADDFAGPTSGTVVIPAGATAGQIVIPIAGDTDEEPDETVELAMTVTYDGPLLLSPLEISAVSTIANDDAAAVPVTPAPTAPIPPPAAQPVVVAPTYTG